MANLPEPRRASGLSPIAAARALRSTRRAELEVFEYGLRAAVDGRKDEIDSQVLGDVFEAAMEEELRLLRSGRSQAGTDPHAHYIVAEKVQAFSKLNNRRIARRFG
jgi:hypothetical protein